jgi:membrane fusion protein, multidrug efflux system
VPQRAVIDSPFGKIVFTVSPDNKLTPQPVELDGWAQGQWIVTKGLKDGDRVLVEGFIKASKPGMTVKPVPYVAGAGAAPDAGNAAGGKPADSANSQAKPAQAPASNASAATK